MECALTSTTCTGLTGHTPHPRQFQLRLHTQSLLTRRRSSRIGCSLSSEFASPLKHSKTRDTQWKEELCKSCKDVARGGAVLLIAAAAFFGGWKGTCLLKPPLAEASEDITSQFDEQEQKVLNDYKKKPGNVAHLRYMLLACLRHGDIPKALNVAANLKYMDPVNLEWSLVRARLFSYANRLHAAESEYEEILQRDPFNIDALQGLVTVLLKFGDQVSPTLLVEDALERARAEKDELAIYNLKLLLGQVYIMQEKFEKALEQFRRLSEEDRKDFRPYLCQGIIYSILGKEGEAEKCFKAYEKCVPKSFEDISILNDFMLAAKSEAHRRSVEIKSNEGLVSRGKQPQRPMKKPVSDNDDGISENDDETAADEPLESANIESEN
eukprot:TRINITY_DN1927_c0_g1_i1.p1 TRINITY_DN1927_c0_g1~~TRINITY_DN1927_c0_g1_i1.p1  ORF type:complete len:382 (+),score=73.15 TRINITY_DN1927_c0_g1_i1:151-1296(+)